MMSHRTTMQLAALVVLVANQQIRGAEMSVVSPSSADGREGDKSSTFGGPGVAPIRIQQLYPSSDFITLPDSHRTITGLAWRQDKSTAVTEVISVPGIEISLSTTTADMLSQTFAENLGGDETLVFNGDLVWQTDSTGSGPREFDFFVPFDTPFVYDPTEGRNLVIDFIALEDPSHVFQMDEQTIGPLSSVVDLSVGPFANLVFDTVYPTRFTFVPEASTIVSAILGLTCLSASRRKRTCYG